MTTIKSVSYIISSSGALSLLLQYDSGPTKSFCVDREHPNHRKIVEKLKAKDFDRLDVLIDISSELEKAQQKVVEMPSLVGKAEIKNGQICVNNVPVHNLITERLMELVSQDFPVDPMLRFLENVLMNPSPKSQEELYDFLSHRNLPLTEDGCFLAYKRVRDDWLDFHSATIDNSIGKVVEFDRENVDPDRSHPCSYGLHVGAIEYVKSYCSGGHIVIVKVNPKDCVSVPRDHNHTKLRVCKYEVLYELDKEQAALDLPVYSSQGKSSCNASDWADEENVLPEEVKEEYWEHGWGNDYENWARSRLAAECVNRGIYQELEDTDDFDKAYLVNILIEDDVDDLFLKDW